MTQAVGRVISFYSFKGGVGRSMALANIALLLSKSGNSVLIVDWDLEAPGLHKFFEKYSPSLRDEIKSKPGIVDLIDSQCTSTKISWHECIIEVRLPGAFLHFISAGQANLEYRSKVQHLQWQRLYDQFNIGQVLDDIRNEWKQSYDFIMLDSRTGVTDIGDICTAILPDMLVTVLTANEQSVDGTKLIIDRARTVHSQLPRDRTKLIVLPLLGRDEIYSEYKLSTEWRGRIDREFSFTLADWLPKSIDSMTYFNKIFVPYYSYWSFGENLPVVEHSRELENPTSIGAAYARMSSLIESNLDWAVLEQGVNTTEITALRERVSRGEAEREKLREKLRTESIAAHDTRRKQYRRLSSIIIALVGLLIAGAGVAYYRHQAIVAAHESAQKADVTLAQNKIDFERQIGELQNQNRDLLDKLTKTTALLEQQNSDVARQISELQRQNRELLDKLNATSISDEKQSKQDRARKAEQARKAVEEEARKAKEEEIKRYQRSSPKN